MPEPWKSLLDSILGPGGAVVVLCTIIFFLWRLFREATAEARSNLALVSDLTHSVKDLTTEVRAWREAARK